MCIRDRLRGGYGVLGNQEIDNYQYSSTITTGINYPDGNGGPVSYTHLDVYKRQSTNLALVFDTAI